MSIDFEGLDNILSALDGLLSEEKVGSGLAKACALVEASAKRKAPKGSGELRRSISSKVEGETGIVFTPLEYAH